MDARVTPCDLSSYGVGLRKHGFFEKYLHKWSLDFWRSIAVSPEVEKIVFFNLINRHRRDFKLSYLPKDKLVLFLWEPPLILPNMYKERNLRRFSKIYTWDDDLVDGITYFKFYYPVLQPMLSELPRFEDKKLCTFVGTCMKSSKKESLYEERKKAIAYFEQIGEEGFEFYGRKWEPCAYKSYRGPIADKIQTIKNYRFSICYENSSTRNGYITEKIFDCFAAGCVPIYWGAPNVETYIPKGCFIDRRDFATMDELYVFLKDMTKQEYEGYIERIRAYLNSEQAQLFSLAHFEEIFFEAVQENSAVAAKIKMMTSNETSSGIASTGESTIFSPTKIKMAASPQLR
jgi:alpha(1,3/1,4) fucosyltransferase